MPNLLLYLELCGGIANSGAFDSEPGHFTVPVGPTRPQGVPQEAKGLPNRRCVTEKAQVSKILWFATWHPTVRNDCLSAAVRTLGTLKRFRFVLSHLLSSGPSIC